MSSALEAHEEAVMANVLPMLMAKDLGVLMCASCSLCDGSVAKHVKTKLSHEEFPGTPLSDELFALHVRETSPAWARLSLSEEHGLVVDEGFRARSWGGRSWLRGFVMRIGESCLSQREKLGHGDRADVVVPRTISALASERVLCVSAGPSHSLVVTASGSLFSFGLCHRGGGNLGHPAGSSPDWMCSVPRRVEALRGERVARAFAGVTHSAALGHDGRLWTWGTNTYGKLGLGLTPELINNAASNAQVLVPTLAALKKKEDKIEDVEVAGGSTMAITTNGKLLAAGKFAVDGPETATFVRAFPELDGLSMVQVCSTARMQYSYHPRHAHGHTLAVDSDGRLYSWGNGDMGALGHGGLEDEPRPRQVAALAGTKIVQAAVARHVSFALTDEGKVWSWGTGALGHGELETAETIPRQHNYFIRGGFQQSLLPAEIPSLRGVSVTCVACGGEGCGSWGDDYVMGTSAGALLDSRGALWRWGRGDAAGSPINRWTNPAAVTALYPARVN
ncbi:hypothetical protein CTAYLR_003298 [Chrysophaeum taylorii]|uniref:RCC1-like domain-containing protein n=1 Tax=Chrysophaeum taylorii TaxID=2483200 RepID=A0AAD7UH71_9STRA|nr:hypothetical protein CTAYLR_003298 [Chrysophaeum taylorii]